VAALQGGRLVVSQPEECAIFIFHTTQDTTSPADSFPRVVSGDGELEGVYRFLSNDRVTPKGILAPHFSNPPRGQSLSDLPELAFGELSPFSPPILSAWR
jgi:hypothetical protein